MNIEGVVGRGLVVRWRSKVGGWGRHARDLVSRWSQESKAPPLRVDNHTMSKGQGEGIALCGLEGQELHS